METISFEELEDFIMRRADGKWIELNIGKFIDIYPFTTENIAGYIDEFDLQNKSLLTVGSSGDQVINAALYDCQDITLLDINPFAKFYVYLKIACLLELSRDDFMKFLRYGDYPTTFKKNNNCFDKNIYKSISSVLESLDRESFLIWNKLFDSYGSEDLRTNIFSLDEYNNRTMKSINPYLASDGAYLKTKAKIQKANIKFLTGDILEVDLKEKYDNIWLSNICQYFSTIELIEKLIDKMGKCLNKEGQLLISYLYGIPSYGTSVSVKVKPIYQLNKLKTKLKDYSLALNMFTGIDQILDVDGGGKKDGILLCKKNN